MTTPEQEREPDAEDDRAECEALRERMSDLLSRTAIALRGEPPPLTLWSWHDLPELAAAAIAALRRLTFAARISGGTAGPDAELMAACDQAEDVLVGEATLAAPAAQPSDKP